MFRPLQGNILVDDWSQSYPRISLITRAYLKDLGIGILFPILPLYQEFRDPPTMPQS